MPTVVSPSNNQDIDGILWGWRWSGADLTYSFPTSSAEYLSVGYNAVNEFEAFNAAQQSAIIRTLTNFSNVCGLNITAVSGGASANLRFAEANSVDYGGINPGLRTISTAEGNPPDPNEFNSYQFGDCWFNHTTYNNPTSGDLAYTAGLMHEIGHAVGLKHGHADWTNPADPEYNFAPNHTFPALPSDHDSQEYSVMTYNTYPDGQGVTNEYPQTLMQNDIAALQYMYGAAFDYNSANTTYTWSSTTGEMSINGTGQGLATGDNHLFLTVWDGGGIDTYDFSNYSTKLLIDLAPGAWTTVSSAQLANLGGGRVARGNIANSLLFEGDERSLIENVIGGSSNDVIRGNVVNNDLRGRNGIDQIFGLGGNDIIFGEGGNDYLLGDDGNDTLTGGLGDDTLEDASGNDQYFGEDGNDQFRVMGLPGTDIFNGGTGADLIGYEGVGFQTGAGVTVSLEISGPQQISPLITNTLIGIEIVFATFFDDSLIGDGNANILVGIDGDDMLSGGGGPDSLDGGAGNDTMLGGSGDDIVQGLAGNDSLNGGAGFDNMIGGTGNDTYVTDGGDTISEDASAGIDTVESSVAHTLGANLEHLTLTGSANINGTGNALANTITGNSGNNTLDGGSGQDALTGGAGNDTFVLANGIDTVSDTSGIDTITSTISRSLASYTTIERLTLLGTANVSGTGNALNNVITGNSGGNVLNGGIGQDTLVGGLGNDSYVTDGGDTITEAANAGTDTVQSSISYTLGSNIEHLTLTGTAGLLGVGNALGNNLIGNTGNNTLRGLDGNDVLNGLTGSDRLEGGLGNDTFYFAAGDTLIELANQGLDTVVSSSNFTLGTGSM